MLFAIALRLPLVFKHTNLVNIHFLLQVEAISMQK